MFEKGNLVIITEDGHYHDRRRGSHIGHIIEPEYDDNYTVETLDHKLYVLLESDLTLCTDKKLIELYQAAYKARERLIIYESAG